MRRGPSIGKQRGAINPLSVSLLEGYDWTQVTYDELAPCKEAALRDALREIYRQCQLSALVCVSFDEWYVLCRAYMQLGKPREVLPLMLQNLSTQEIATQLNRSKGRIDTHISSLKSAFGARSREFLMLLMTVSGVFMLPQEFSLKEQAPSIADFGKRIKALLPLETSPLRTYDWSQLKYKELSARDEKLFGIRLKDMYETKCKISPFISSYISFKEWYALYRVYMEVGDGQRRVLSLMAQNLTTQEIAAQLDRTTVTINAHVSELKSAFGARSRGFLIFLLAISGVFEFNRKDVRNVAA